MNNTKNCEVVSKATFAAMTKTSPSAVSNWIRRGVLSGEALQGEGRDQRIVVEAALRQVRERRDVGQAFGNGLKTACRPVEQRSDSSMTLTDVAPWLAYAMVGIGLPPWAVYFIVDELMLNFRQIGIDSRFSEDRLALLLGVDELDVEAWRERGGAEYAKRRDRLEQVLSTE